MGPAAGVTPARRARARDFFLRDARTFELLAALLFLVTKLALFWGRKPAYTGDKGVFARLGKGPLTDITF
jgi:hypothetical protein